MNLKTLSLFPARFWEKKTGPLEVSLIIIAISKNNGEKVIRPKNDRNMSNKRFRREE